MGFPKLTEAQRKPLFELVEHEQQTGREQVYHFVDNEIYCADSSFSVEDVPAEVIQMWFERGYVTCRSLAEDQLYGLRLNLLLSQDARDYQDRMSKPQLIRGLLNWWEGASGDARTAFFGVIGGVVGGVLISVITRLLGL